ncbi:hypothetical protein PP175_19620 [Aneurinibacillus sp. Ricciae_BoGa-3]|uniref:hypothetical protein n=1 Tax=Aneurinibacillus sp. Ricciae_BoGa-3 TaxID=3022697 RepID=UPI00234102B4|nr:hypothetical protein [Aneurinibacillus sp. Ricciae_BoGa-3]WCK53526.1 hypothetical protein PP175_19620 [Aneurinibacillus sp. Ricciae_BoGa-3]
MAKEVKLMTIMTATKTGYNVKTESGNVLRDEMKEFDEGFPDGIYAAPQPGEPIIKLGAMYRYCREKGKKPQELTKEELNRFLVYDK